MLTFKQFVAEEEAYVSEAKAKQYVAKLLSRAEKTDFYLTEQETRTMRHILALHPKILEYTPHYVMLYSRNKKPTLEQLDNKVRYRGARKRRRIN